MRNFLLLLFIIIFFLFHFKEKYKTIKNFNSFDIDNSIELPNIKWEKSIPKIIYRTHKTEKECLQYQQVFDQTNKYLKSYKTVFYYQDDVDNFIKDKYGQRIYNVYNSINPQYGPAKADFFRYLVIYYYGGIYMDIKSGPVKNIDSILENLNGKMAISNWTNIPIGLIPIDHIDELYWSSILKNNYGEYQNWYIISGKGNPILKKIIQQMITNIEQGLKNKNCYNQGKISVVEMTGPLMMTKVIEKNDTNYIKLFKPNLNNHLKYKIIDHKKVEKNNHYLKQKNKNILLYE